MCAPRRGPRDANSFPIESAKGRNAGHGHAAGSFRLKKIARINLSSESHSTVPRPANLALAASLIGCSLVLSGTARADFRLCNNTTSRVSIALAYTDGEAWVSEGWWNVKPNGCETLVRGALAAQFYYAYAMDERGGEWKGKAFMCTRDREFKISGRNDCFTRGFDRTGFFEIDTGKDSRNWTVQLTDPAPQASAAQPALKP